MSITLRMADGDIYLDSETGRAEIIDGPTKADQDLAECYLTEFNVQRRWGADLALEKLGDLTPATFKTMLFMRVTEANARMMEKQARDPNPTVGEMITGFTSVNIGYDPDTQAGYFVSVAQLEDGSTVQKGGSIDFRPVSLRHIVPPPTDISIRIVKG